MDRFLPLALAATLLCAPRLGIAHPGGLDHDGGHVDHKTGQYHLHRLDYSAEAKSRGVVATPPSGRSAPRASAPDHYLAGVGQIPADLLTKPAPIPDRPPATAQPSSKPSITPAPTKAGLMMARTGWAVPNDKPAKPLPTLAVPLAVTPAAVTGYAKEHSLTLRAFHDKRGEFLCIGEVSATSPAAATIVLASGDEKSVDFVNLCYADRAFIAAQQNRRASELAEELARDHGYRLWRIDKTRSTMKAKVIAYDGKKVWLKGKTPSIAVHPVSDLNDEDQAHLQQLAALFGPPPAPLAQAEAAP